MALGAMLIGMSALQVFGAKEKLVVHLRDGSMKVYLMADVKRISMNGADLVVEQEDASDAFVRTSVSKINFSENPGSGIDDVTAVSVAPRLSGNMLFVDGLTSETEAFIFDASGALTKGSGRIGAGKGIDVTDLSSGVYLVYLSDGRSFKFMKR